MSFDNVCRVCSGTLEWAKGGICLLDATNSNYAYEARISFNLQINDLNGLPTKLCGYCIKEFDNWAIMRHKSVTSNVKFCHQMFAMNNQFCINEKSEIKIDSVKSLISEESDEDLDYQQPSTSSANLYHPSTSRRSNSKVPSSGKGRSRSTNLKLKNPKAPPAKTLKVQINKIEPECKPDVIEKMEPDVSYYPVERDVNFDMACDGFGETMVRKRGRKRKKVNHASTAEPSDLSTRELHLPLETLLNVKMEIETVTCQFCYATFPGRKRLYNLQRHYRDVHPNDGEELDDGTSALQECKICHAEFSQANWRQTLKTHLRLTHKLSGRHAFIKQLNSYKCHECGKLLATADSLDKHSLMHKAPQFSCVYCDHKMITAGGLKIHMNRTHGVSTSKITCKICKAGFASKSDMERHSLNHFEPMLSCFHCHKVHKLKRALDTHMYSKHSECNCQACDRTRSKLLVYRDSYENALNWNL